MRAQARQVNEAVDGAQQMVGGDVGIERELVEQGALLDLPRSHHLLRSPPLDKSESPHDCRCKHRVFQTESARRGHSSCAAARSGLEVKRPLSCSMPSPFPLPQASDPAACNSQPRGAKRDLSDAVDQLGGIGAAELHRRHAVDDLEGERAAGSSPDVVRHLADDRRELAVVMWVRSPSITSQSWMKISDQDSGLPPQSRGGELAGLHLRDMVTGTHGVTVVDEHEGDRRCSSHAASRAPIWMSSAVCEAAPPQRSGNVQHVRYPHSNNSRIVE